jgi:hypothetical protein
MRELALSLLLLVGWGAPAVVPWRLAAAPPERRRWWAWGAPTLLLAAIVGAAALLGLRADQAVAAGLVPLRASLAGRLLLPLVPGLLAATLLAAFAWQRLEDVGWKMIAAFGFATLVAVAWAGELLESTGEEASPWFLALRIACRVLLALGAGEVLAPGRAIWAPLAGLALPAYLLLLPPDLRLTLWHHGGAPTLAAGTLVLLATRWLPPSLRRAALAVGALLVAAFLLEASRLDQLVPAIATPSFPPLPRP